VKEDSKLYHQNAKGEELVSSLPPGDWSEDVFSGASPSGKWIVLSGAREEGDYIHRKLLFLNRQDGALIPIREGAAPKPLTKAEIEQLEDTERVPTYDAVGETTIEWLPTTDVLLVDHLLFTPGNAPIEIDGDVAPW
jgi:hypothetical protein